MLTNNIRTKLIIVCFGLGQCIRFPRIEITTNSQVALHLISTKKDFDS